jgi:hypothetical protein
MFTFTFSVKHGLITIWPQWVATAAPSTGGNRRYADAARGAVEPRVTSHGWNGR